MKSKEITDIVTRDAWTGAEGTHDGKPLLIRFRQEFRQVSDLSGYPLLLHISWSFQESDDLGLPSDAEMSAMEQFEERILAAYEHDFHAVLTAVITTNGTRQWIFYTSDIDECGERLTEMPQEGEPYPLELTADEDPEWSFLRQRIFAGCEDDAT